MPSIILEGAAKPVIDLEGRSIIYFGGTNYLGLSYHQDVILAAQEGLVRWGLSSAGSRETTGGANVHNILERRLAEFLNRPSVITCCSGYLINLILFQVLKDSFDVCILDENSHCSLKDAACGSGMIVDTFHTGDLDDLSTKLRRNCAGTKRALICSDGVFSSGEIAPLGSYHEIAREWNSALVVDDAHGFGVLGEHGRGTLELLGIGNRHTYQTGTLSKALGCFGGFAAGDEEMAEFARRNSEAYIGSTPTPPAVAAASIASIGIAVQERSLREKLATNIETMKTGLRAIGIKSNSSPSPIATFVIGTRKHNEKIHRALLNCNILIPYNFYPGGPETGSFRMAVTARHSREQIKQALELLDRLITSPEP